MKYIFVNENESFGFKTDEINEITENDIVIDKAVYNRFFEEQSQGKQFKIKDINGTAFEDIFEEVIPVPIVQEKTEEEKIKERVSAVEDALLFLMDGGI